MADSGGHQAAAANGGGDQAEAMAENGDNQAAAANGEDQAEGMEDNGDNQAAAANRGDQAEGMEANGAGGNGGGIPAQDEGSHAVDVAAEYWAAGDVDAGARRPTAVRRVAEEALYEVLLRMPAAEVARCSTV
ncbi:hypothetical protein E2562_022761 [Oryza meyeriana var. granulata]|uniref:Uncharacterized protein n=1 Tax=Oryza meyeriana var. granulata TaxID=110450 RepID=A0A6G1FB48_9ORYZ|nr:hypothetical protein E2562_022761 [Oryza meyeriana var. granulata]